MSEWISVKDRLPEKDGEYIAAEKFAGIDSDGKKGQIYILHFARYLDEVKDSHGDPVFCNHESGWYFIDFDFDSCRDFYWDVTKRVSYWMPMPELPVEEKEVCR